MFLYDIIIFVFGLSVGSFLNVVIFRLENGWSIVNDRSKCMHCKHILAWNDLVPVASFLFLGGTCRYCKKNISRQYPIVEISTALIFILISNSIVHISNEVPVIDYQLLSSLFYYFIIASSLIVIFVYDLRHYIIPDEVILIAVVVSLVYNISIDSTLRYMILSGFKSVHDFQGGGDLFTGFSNMTEFLLANSVFLNYLFAALVSFVFFFSIVFFTRGKGMGGGDVKLGFLMGLVIGWPNITLAILLSFIIGSVFGIALVISKKKDMKSMIPFGPFLVIGTFLMLFWGEKIMRWYFGLFMLS